MNDKVIECDIVPLTTAFLTNVDINCIHKSSNPYALMNPYNYTKYVGGAGSSNYFTYNESLNNFNHKCITFDTIFILDKNHQHYKTFFELKNLQNFHKFMQKDLTTYKKVNMSFSSLYFYGCLISNVNEIDVNKNKKEFIFSWIADSCTLDKEQLDDINALLKENERKLCI